MWDKPPTAEVMVNDQSFFKGEIISTEQSPTSIEFETELENDKQHSLKIIHSGKTLNQTVVNEKGDLLKDQLLNIKNIEIDEIDIGGLLYEGVYTPTYPEPWATQQRQAGINLQESFKNVTKTGHNGEWKLTFESPFYMWLLENLY